MVKEIWGVKNLALINTYLFIFTYIHRFNFIYVVIFNETRKHSQCVQLLEQYYYNLTVKKTASLKECNRILRCFDKTYTLNTDL